MPRPTRPVVVRLGADAATHFKAATSQVGLLRELLAIAPRLAPHVGREKEPATTRFAFRLQPAEHDTLRSLAKKRGTSIGELVADLLELQA